MKMIISGKNIKVTDGLRASVEEKLSRLEKFFIKETEFKIVLSTEKNLQRIEVSIPISGGLIRAEDSEEDLYNAIDKVVEKLSKQLRKHKTKLKRKGNSTIRFENITSFEDESDELKDRIVRRKTFGFKPMSEEEAILQMELLGHDFFVFINSVSEETNVLYKRHDGNYGILEP
ncbi:MAG: ribosome-associated translation inhibitor RaiA [Peptostreptococcaceae bacterium]|jgi:putative sigma-54 modulation protein|nr:ribosome-associated translation inhibitor RaiA [Peptostreptococcaceae bacterium]